MNCLQNQITKMSKNVLLTSCHSISFKWTAMISGNKKQEILANCKTEEEREKTDQLIRPILRGRDIKRYAYDFEDKYLIATFPSKNYNIDDYHALKGFLEGFKPKLKQTGE